MATEVEDPVPLIPEGHLAPKQAPPPGNGSFVRKIRKARQVSSSNVEFVKNSYQETIGQVAGEWCRLVCSLSSCAFLGLILPVVEICIGGVYLHDCPINHLIPVFLLVNGSVALAFSILGCHGNVRKSVEYFQKRRQHEKLDSYEQVDQCLSGKTRVTSNFAQSIFSIFLLAWLIAGAVWVFDAKPSYHSVRASTTDPLYCNPAVFKLSFWVIIFQIVCYGAAILFVILVFICLCVISCCVNGSEEEKQSFAAMEHGAKEDQETKQEMESN